MRRLGWMILVFVIYVGAYAAYRAANAVVWDRDGKTYVIYPTGVGITLYYLWRPLSYLDAAITGMHSHIGPHR